jgi:hypothetical protein
VPDRKLHNRFNELVLGASFSSVSEIMDEPYSRFKGKHRNLRHDTPFLIETLDKLGLCPALAAWLHLILDYDRELARTMQALESLRGGSGKSERRGSRRRICEG